LVSSLIVSNWIFAVVEEEEEGDGSGDSIQGDENNSVLAGAELDLARTLFIFLFLYNLELLNIQ
jgi:hypothetical protein